MSKGTDTSRDATWRRGQRKEGFQDALHGRQGKYSDQFYQRGFRAGVARRFHLEKEGVCLARLGGASTASVCGRVPKADWLEAEFSGEWVPVCGTHGHVAERRGFTVKWR